MIIIANINLSPIFFLPDTLHLTFLITYKVFIFSLMHTILFWEYLIGLSTVPDIVTRLANSTQAGSNLMMVGEIGYQYKTIRPLKK